MVKKILFLITLLIIPTSLFANNEVGIIAANWFTTFSTKISKLNTTENQISYFKSFSDKLNLLLLDKKFNTTQIKLIEDLIKLSNEYTFEKRIYLKEKSNKNTLKQNNILNGFKNISYNNDNLFLENGIWYTYKFDSYLKFPNGTEITKIDLAYNGIKEDNSIVFLKDNKTLGFVTNYEKIKIIDDSIVYGIPGKYNFLKEIKDDKRAINYETDELFQILKNKTIEITKGKTENEKIKIIYNYILNNISYSSQIDLSNHKIFSGIDTFTNNDGVCEGYTKMFLYMLNFAGINDTEVIRGDVLDAKDFPEIGHAWIRIGDRYYDPTFDDPIGTTKTKKYPEYIFFGLPYDLFYTNRYNFNKTPSFLKQKSLSYRKDFIKKRTIPMVYKYKNSGYNILKPFLIKLENGIELDKKLDIEDLKKIIPYYEINNYSFNENGIKKNIKKIRYYIINDTLINNTIEQINYSFDGFYLFKWNLDNGSYEYRLAYFTEFH